MESDLTKIPARIKYYLLDWKENNMKDFETMFGEERKLNELSIEQLYTLFKFATDKDYSVFNLFKKQNW